VKKLFNNKYAVFAFNQRDIFPKTGYRHIFCSSELDLDLDPMTLIYKPDLDIPKM